MTPRDGSQPAVIATTDAVDVAAERMRTVGATRSHHLNAAGSALPSVTVVDTVVQHLRLEEAIGGYEAAAVVRERVDAIYDSTAALIGAHASEIALFDSASTGLRVLLDALRPAAGSRIIAASTTYVSHALHLMTLSREHQVELVLAPVDDRGCVDLEALDAMLADGRPTIVTVSHVPTSSGLIEPVEAIGEVTRRHGAVYILDATQSVGHLAVDVAAVGCDILVTTGRKFLRAPRGTGFAYIAAPMMKRLAPTAPDVRGAQWSSPLEWELTSSARRYETWEAAVAARLGLGVAVDEVLARGILRTQDHLRTSGRTVRAALEAIPGVRLADPAGADSAIVTFDVGGVVAPVVVEALSRRSVRVVSVPATHGQWDLGARGLDAVVRASLHVYNDDSDIAALADAVAAVAADAADGAA
jgi:selenocysteine lyase/cysteine desulfurase